MALMDVFKRSEKVKDMATDKGRDKFIEGAAQTKHKEEHILHDNSLELKLPPLDLPSVPPPTSIPEPLNNYLADKKNIDNQAMFDEKVIQLKIVVRDKKLFDEMLDGINEIADNYGSDVILEFHIEKNN